MWRVRTLRPADQISKIKQDKWTEITKISNYLEKAETLCSRIESRANLWLGGIFLLIAFWIYKWATGNTRGILRYGYAIELPVYRIIFMVSAVFGIVGIIKIALGIQGAKSN